MTDRCDYDEDLPHVAAETFASAHRSCCSACREMHALWPYIRLAGAWLGGEASSPRLISALADCLADGRRKVLIAGAADTGLLALTARAGGTQRPDIAVLDRCATPIEACRRMVEPARAGKESESRIMAWAKTWLPAPMMAIWDIERFSKGVVAGTPRGTYGQGCIVASHAAGGNCTAGHPPVQGAGRPASRRRAGLVLVLVVVVGL